MGLIPLALDLRFFRFFAAFFFAIFTIYALRGGMSTQMLINLYGRDVFGHLFHFFLKFPAETAERLNTMNSTMEAKMSTFDMWMRWCCNLEQAKSALKDNADSVNFRDYLNAYKYAIRRCVVLERALTCH